MKDLWKVFQLTRVVGPSKATLSKELASCKQDLETTVMDRDRLAAELATYKHAFETTSIDRDGLAAELATYKHAFETTSVDRDRLAAQSDSHRAAPRDAIDMALGLLAYSLLREQRVALDSIEERLARLDESHEPWAQELRSLSEISLRQRASDGLIRLANFLLREIAVSDFGVDLVDVALQLDNRFRGVQHAFSMYYFCRAGVSEHAKYLETGVHSGAWPDAETRKAQQLAIGRGLPPIFLVTMPKSGSIFVLTTIAKFLNLPQFQLALSHDNAFGEILLEPLVGVFAQGGLIAQHHLSPSSTNIEILKRHNLSRLVVHFRDPRQAAVSWWHYNLKIGAHRVRLRTQAEIEEVIWNDFLVPGAAWLRGWLDVADSSPDFEIFLSTQEEMAGNEFDHIGKILNFLQVPEQQRDLLVADKSGAVHFRKGSKDEWLEFFSNDFKRRSLQLLPNELARRFGWRCVEERDTTNHPQG